MNVRMSRRQSGSGQNSVACRSQRTVIPEGGRGECVCVCLLSLCLCLSVCVSRRMRAKTLHSIVVWPQLGENSPSGLSGW